MRVLRREDSAMQPVIGQLRKGAEQTIVNGKKNVGSDLTYFRFKGINAGLNKRFAEIYPFEPNDIVFYLDGDKIEDVWMSCYESYGSDKNCRQRHDGQRVYTWMDAQGIKFAADFEENPYRKYKGFVVVDPNEAPKLDDKAQLINRLSMKIYGLGVNHGVTTFSFKSINDGLMIDSCLQAAFNEFNRLRGIPFVLSRGEREYSAPDTDRQGKILSQKRVKRKKSLCMVAPHPDWYAQWQAQQIAKLGLQNVPLALLSVRSIDPDTGEILGGASHVDSLIDEIDFVDEADEEGTLADDIVLEGSYREASPFVSTAPRPAAAAPSAPPPLAAPAPELESVATTVMGPNWGKKRDQILAIWANAAELADSVNNNRKAWQAFGLGRADMPVPGSKTPQGEPTVSELIDDQKILV